MTRARRSFDRADLRRATLTELAARLDALCALPRPDTKAARKQIYQHKVAVRAEIAARVATGKPSESPHKGRKVIPDTEDLRLGEFFETYTVETRSPPDTTEA